MSLQSFYVSCPFIYAYYWFFVGSRKRPRDAPLTAQKGLDYAPVSPGQVLGPQRPAQWIWWLRGRPLPRSKQDSDARLQKPLRHTEKGFTRSGMSYDLFMKHILLFLSVVVICSLLLSAPSVCRPLYFCSNNIIKWKAIISPFQIYFY